LRAYARAIGLAFQIADDILDVTGDSATAGKALRKDAEAGKATFVSLLGLDGARARAERVGGRGLRCPHPLRRQVADPAGPRALHYRPRQVKDGASAPEQAMSQRPATPSSTR
jgi:hypothetical protein